MTEEYQKLLDTVRGFNRDTIRGMSASWLASLLDDAGVIHERIEHEPPQSVVDFRQVPEFSLNFVLSNEGGDALRVIVSFNKFGDICSVFLGKAVK